MCQRRGETCISRLRPDRGSSSPMPTGTRAEPSHNQMTYVNQTTGEIEIYDARASASDMARSVDVTAPRDSGAKPGSHASCPADITSCGECSKTGDDRHGIPSCESSENAGWGHPSHATTLRNTYMPAGEPIADPSYSVPWAGEPCSWEALPKSLWDWSWPQSQNVTGSETDNFSHSSVPAPQPGEWPFGGEAREHRYPSRSSVMPLWGRHSQGLYPQGPSFAPRELTSTSVALGPSSIPATAPSRSPESSRMQQVEEAGLSLQSEAIMSFPPCDAMSTVSAKFPMIDPYRRSMYQQPSFPVPVRNIEQVRPEWLQSLMDYRRTKFSPFDNVGGNSQELARTAPVLEDHAEQLHWTQAYDFNTQREKEPFL